MIRQFHYVDWPEQGVPKSGEGFIEFITQVHKTKEQFGHEGPITVHCRYVFFSFVLSFLYSIKLIFVLLFCLVPVLVVQVYL